MVSGELDVFSSFILNSVSASRFCNSLKILIAHMHVFNHHFPLPRIHAQEKGNLCLQRTLHPTVKGCVGRRSQKTKKSRVSISGQLQNAGFLSDRTRLP